jgi:hypothetical protein
MVLDQATVFEQFKHGSVELLPILRQIKRSRVTLATAQIATPPPKAHPPSPVPSQLSAVVPVEAVDSQPIGDRLADAVFEKSPQLRFGLEIQSTVRARSGPVDMKRYTNALRPRVIAPIGRMEKSVTVRLLLQRHGPVANSHI